MLPSPNIDMNVPLADEVKGNQLFPVFIKLNTLRTLLIGGGNIGLEKLSAILNNSQQADVRLVAEKISPEILELAKKYPTLKVNQKSYEADDLNEVDIVFAATNDNVLNEVIRTEAHKKGLLINVADKPELCDFYLGSIVQKGDLKIAIST
ncbi:MAG: bifunctional precorrin-2 dehydrogenase/sirohydrochlorin ferrochelatase, partial [Pedobacter sp.]